jgi:2-iminobutanoate/2-iminopropanoate deaminase
MEQRVIHAEGAPKPVGPYSQAVQLGRLVFTAGQVALDANTGKLVGDDIRAQTRQVLGNLDAVLGAAGSSLKHVLKTTVFLTDLADFAAMNGVYAERFSETPPARSTVQVAALPGGARVEIEVVAYVPTILD